MFKQAALGLMVVAVFAVGCKSTVEKQGEVNPPVPVVQQPAAPPPSVALAPVRPEAGPTGEGYDILKITAELPQEVLDAAAQGASCPSSLLTNLFGVNFSNPHGCIIGSLTPGGLAEKAGLMVGDSIVGCNGGEVTCPRTMAPLLSAPKEPGKVELIVHRPK